MGPLGPFGAAPRLAAGVSGGPHSLALALLAQGWAWARGGDLLALVADHGLRAESGAEAEGVAEMLAARGIRARVLRLGLLPGPRLQERARAARLSALAAAAAAEGRPWLLLGHHRADQAETVLFRALRGSGPAGLAGMAAVRDAGAVLLLRPLLGVPPAALEAVLAGAGMRPVRDPSNRDPRFARIRLRQVLADPGGEGAGIGALAAAAAAFAARRDRAAAALAAELGETADLRPEGFARLAPGASAAALAAVIAMVGGGAFAPGATAVAALARRGGGTLGGAWVRAAAGGAWLVARDPGTVAGAVPARPGAVWDRRFRLAGPGREGWSIGALGAGARALRARSDLPAAVLAALPAIRDPHGVLAAVPALDYPAAADCAAFRLVFAPGAGGFRPGWPFKGGQPDPIYGAEHRRTHPAGTETDNRT